MPLSLDYRLTGTGWAACSLSDGKSSCEITASYLSDALYRLVLAGIAALSGFNQISFSFDEEPGEYRWVISSPRLNEFEIEILSFPALWGDQPDSEGRSLFKTRCVPETFAKAVQSALHTVLETHGESGYLELWSEHPFPSSQFAELNRLLNENERDG